MSIPDSGYVRPILHVEWNLNYVWNAGTLIWEPMTQPGGGGGGSGTEYTQGAVSPANPVAPALSLRRRDALIDEGTAADGDWVTLNGTLQGELYVKHAGALPFGTNTIGKVNQGTAASASNAWYAREYVGSAFSPVSAASGASLVAPSDSFTFSSVGSASELIIFTIEGTYAGATLTFALKHGLDGVVVASEPILGFRHGSNVVESSSGSLTNTTRTWLFYIPASSTAATSALVITLTGISSGSVDCWATQSKPPSLPFATVNDGGGALSVDDNGGSLTIDGTVTANAGTGPFPVSDNAGSLTVDAPVGTPVFVRLSDGAAAITALPVTDNAGSLTVDGSVTANAGTNLNTSALALDATLTGRTQKSQITDGTRDGTVKAASTAAVAADTAVVVSLSPNSPLPTGSNVVGALTANQSVNTAQVGGAATVTAAAGVQKVGVVGNAGAIFDAATGAAVPANALHTGARAATANPANATGGNMVAVMADKAGRLVVTNAHARDLVSHQQTNIAVNTETTIVTAGGAGVFNDLVQLIVTTAGLAAQTITIKDATAGTTRFVINYPNAAVAPGTPLILNFDPPIPQAAAAANWTVTQSLATACNYTARYIKNT